MIKAREVLALVRRDMYWVIINRKGGGTVPSYRYSLLKQSRTMVLYQLLELSAKANASPRAIIGEGLTIESKVSHSFNILED